MNQMKILKRQLNKVKIAKNKNKKGC